MAEHATDAHEHLPDANKLFISVWIGSAVNGIGSVSSVTCNCPCVHVIILLGGPSSRLRLLWPISCTSVSSD